MQNIMNKDVVDQIEQLLSNKVQVDKKEKSILDHINGELDKFVFNINELLKKIDENYEFKPKKNIKKNVTSIDVTESIISAFFEKRLLRVNSKDVKNLSSGEQRKAILDVIYAFLLNKGIEAENLGRNIILAIDEPEISQDSSSCYDQFDRLYKVATQLNTQVILTTHWYGILPVIDGGTLIHIDKNIKKVFDFFNFLDQQANFPDDLHMKSLYDLSNSIRNYLRSENSKNLIVCEGGTDKRYLETFLNLNAIRILPCGGKDNVFNLYRLLHISIKNDSALANAIRKKALFLVDTDDSITDYDELPKDTSGKIAIRRLQIDLKTGKPILIAPYDTRTELAHSTTRIEDVLDAKLYYNAIHEAIGNQFEFTANYAFAPNYLNSRLHPAPSIIYPKSAAAHNNINQLLQKISNLKTEISHQYCNAFRKEVLMSSDLSFYHTADALEKYFKEDVIDMELSRILKAALITRLAVNINSIAFFQLPNGQS